MSRERLEVTPEGVSSFVRDVEEKYNPSEKTKWSEFTRRLLDENKTPSLEEFFLED